MSVISPLHTPEIDGVLVRFFRAPRQGPHLPWHAVDDLYRSLRISEAGRRGMLEQIRIYKRSEAVTVATAVGLVTIAPNFVAQGLIRAAIHLGLVEATFERAYNLALAAALVELTGDLPRSAMMEFLVTAYLNSAGDDGGPEDAA